MRVSAYGRALEILRRDGGWQVFDLGNEGKKRVAHDIQLPGDLDESELLDYLGDLLHEHAVTPDASVKRLK